MKRNLSPKEKQVIYDTCGPRRQSLAIAIVEALENVELDTATEKEALDLPGTMQSTDAQGRYRVERHVPEGNERVTEPVFQSESAIHGSAAIGASDSEPEEFFPRGFTRDEHYG